MVDRLSFRWSYVIVPVIVFLLSVVLFASFLHLLPDEVAVHFDLDGNPDNWFGRPMTGVMVLAPQLLFVLLAIGIAWGITRLDRRYDWAKSSGVRTRRMVFFMGNFMALPQLILLFAMLDIFVYNAYQTHILPMWIFLLVVLGVVTIALVVFSIFILLRARRAMSQPEE